MSEDTKNLRSRIVLSWKVEEPPEEDTLFEDIVHSVGESKIAIDKILDEEGQGRSVQFQNKTGAK